MENKENKDDLIKEEKLVINKIKKNKKKKKKEKPILTLNQKILKVIKIITLLWMGIGTLFLIGYEFKDAEIFPKKISDQVYSRFEYKQR